MKNQKVLIFLILFLLLMVCEGRTPLGAGSLLAETKTEASSGEPWTVELIQKLSSESASAMEIARGSVTPETATQLGVDVRDLENRVRMYAELNATYDGLLSEIRKETELKKDVETVQEAKEIFQQRGLLKKPPYSLSYLDGFLADIDSFQQLIETSTMAQNAALRNAEDARIRWLGIQDQIQRYDDTKTGNGGSDKIWGRDGLQLEAQLANATWRLHSRRADNFQLQKQISMDKMDLARNQAKIIQNNLSYNEEDLNKQLNALIEKKKELQTESDLLKRKKKDADQQWVKIRSQFQKSVDGSGPELLGDKLKGLEQWRRTYQEAIDQHDEMLRLVDLQQQVWKQRYDLLKKVPERAVLLEWYEQNKEHLDHINRMLPLEQQGQNNLWQQTGNLDDISSEAEFSSKLRGNAAFLQALRQLAIYRLDYIGMLVACQRLEHRLSTEIEMHLEQKPIRYQAERIWAQIRAVWNYQVLLIDDRPLTVQKLFVALMILLVGIITTKIMIGRIVDRLLRRRQIKTTTVATIEKLMLYISYLLVVLFALRMVNIPLAAFAFLGGAVAIGVGFGAQNLINNFISGFIIMGEQPISIGNLIEVDGVLGQVEEIGARCTRIRTGENIHILVPNSSFLEKNITNWTLSDQLIRAYVNVGVVYGSPVQQVEQLLLKACGEFDTIHKSPKPFVLFTDFGDNALMFKINFWISVRRVIERHMVESQLRFRIDALFREAGIIIAFPQRDVHLDSSEPLKIQMLTKTDT